MNDSDDRTRFARAKAILQDVLAGPRQERMDRARAACGDDTELFAEVESLLSFESSSLAADLDSSALDHLVAAEDDAAVDLSGTMIGAYRLERLLGRGGMGSVYLAARADGEFDKRVAVKLIRRSAMTPNQLQRFRAERQILADIEHPNVARLLDGGTLPDGAPYFLMEYVDGETLAERIETGPLPVAEARHFARGIAAALAAVHSRGLVFRDLKPSNVMITADGTVKVVDFGIAKATAWTATAPAQDLTEPGLVIGSPSYMSPEQAMGDVLDARSDIFAFGTVLHHAIGGELPFRGETRRTYVSNLLTAPPAALPRHVPVGLVKLIEDCLHKEPERRPASGRELVGRLAELDAAIRARGDRALPMIAVAAIVAAVAVGLWSWRTWRDPATGPNALAPEPIVTWASIEKDPRVSPDGRWQSFISDRDGVYRVWFGAAGSGDFAPLPEVADSFVSHYWSPESDRVAILTFAPDRYGIVIQSIGPGHPVEVHTLDRVGLQVVGWTVDGIYLAGLDSILRYEPDSGRLVEVGSPGISDVFNYADVDPTGRRAVFTAREDNRVSLRVGDLQSGVVEILHTDRIDPEFPRWLDEDSIVYLSREGGQTDVWHMSLSTRRRRRLTFSQARESGLHAAAGGSYLLVENLAESANLQITDPSSSPAISETVTIDSLSDSQPTASLDGGILAFQRSARMGQAGEGKHAQIYALQPGSEDLPHLVVEGIRPDLSPDGRWLAYEVLSTSGFERRLLDLATGTSTLVHGRASQRSMSVFPLEYSWVNREWSPDGPTLYHVVDGEEGDELHATRVDRVVTGEPSRRAFATAIEDDEITDVRVAADGSRVAFVVRSPTRSVSELHRLDTRMQASRVVFAQTLPLELRLLGWMDGDPILARVELGASRVRAEVLHLTSAVRVEPLVHIEDYSRGSLALDPARRLVYFTRMERGVHSLFVASLDDGEERRVRRAETPGRAFAGLRVLADGRLLYSQQDRNRDIWSISFEE